MAYTWWLLLDPSAFILISCATITIFIGARRSLSFYKTNFDGAGAISQVMEEAAGNEIKLATAITLPVFGSLVLLALFYFLDWLQYLLLIIFTIASFVGLLSTFTPFYEFLVNAFKLPREIRPFQSCNWPEPFSTAVVAGIPLALAIVIIWLIWPYFLLTDALALCLGISAMMFLRIPNYKIAAVILCLFFFYDIFWVFISKYIFGSNVMVKVATGMPTLPIVVMVPRVILEGYSLLGMGDITLPGLYLCYLRRFDDHIRPQESSKYFGFTGYFRVGLVCYTFGLIWTFVMLILLEMAQPALLYLVPSILIPSALLAWRKGEFQQLWDGFSTEPATTTQTVSSATEDMEMGEGYSQVPVEDTTHFEIGSEDEEESEEKTV